MMTFAELLDIDKGRISRSEQCIVELIFSKVMLRERKGFLSRLWGWIKGEPLIATNLLRFEVVNREKGNKYTVFIECDIMKNFQKLLNSKVKIFCACPDFMYRATYKRNKDETLFRSPTTDEYLGEALTVPPTVVTTTPSCKHIYAVSEYLRKNYKDITIVTNK